ncbi:hypothetical protein CJI54_03285 [Bifidobacteriaceae bacterium NR026]|nr:hypothetical protein CJI54_03285 [Bifidobacteriaceae bacterium NR026]
MLKLHLHTTLYSNKILYTNMFQRNRTTRLPKQGGDSRFFAAKEVSLSAEGGDSPREQEKLRISVFKRYAIVLDIQKV